MSTAREALYAVDRLDADIRTGAPIATYNRDILAANTRLLELKALGQSGAYSALVSDLSAAMTLYEAARQSWQQGLDQNKNAPGVADADAQLIWMQARPHLKRAHDTFDSY